MATDQQIAVAPGASLVSDAPTSSTIHAQLLRAISSNKDAEDVRADLRRVAKEAARATFVAHLISTNQATFTIDSERLEGDFPKQLAATSVCNLANVAMARQSTQVKVAGQFQIICTPVSPPGTRGEVLVVALHSELGGLRSATYTIELAGSYQRLWAQGNVAAANHH